MQIVPVRRVDATFHPGPWPWAEQNRGLIDENWRRRRAEKPALFNGIVLVNTHLAFTGDLLEVRLRQTDYASFLTMIDLGFPDAGVGNCFGGAVLRACDGTILLGEMGAHTANAGRAYFPGGTLDMTDVRPDGQVDVDASIRRELLEETGLGEADVVFAEDFIAVLDGGRTALLKEARSPLSAEALRDRINTFIAAEAEPELAGVRLVRSLDDVDPAVMPAYVTGYLRQVAYAA